MPLPHKKIKRPERQRLFALLGLMVLVFSAWLLFSPYGAVRYYRVGSHLRTAKAENQRVAAENKQLATEIRRLRNDRTYQEAVARKDFGLIRKNELLFDFSGEKKKDKEEE